MGAKTPMSDTTLDAPASTLEAIQLATKVYEQKLRVDAAQDALDAEMQVLKAQLQAMIEPKSPIVPPYVPTMSERISALFTDRITEINVPMICATDPKPNISTVRTVLDRMLRVGILRRVKGRRGWFALMKTKTGYSP